MAQAAALAADEPAPARELNPSIPQPLSDLIADLLAKSPADRPDSAADVIERLRDLRNEPLEEELEPQRRSFLRRHAAALVVGVWLAVAALAVIAVTRGGIRPDEATSATPPSVDPAPQAASTVEYLCDRPKLVELKFPPPDAPQPPDADGTVRVGRVPSPHGIFMHGAPAFDKAAFASYSLEKKYSRFTAEVAMNDGGNKWTGVVFVVKGDGKELWRSDNKKLGESAEKCDVDVRGVGMLTLEVRTMGTEHGAHGAWIEPRLTK